jgi:hypothetical protein
LLVDELDDFSRVSARSAGVEIVTADARAAQEDAARALLPPGGSLAYRLDSPVASVTVRAFAASATRLAVSVGEQTAEPLPGVVRGVAGGDYGYLVPLEFQVAAAPAAAGTVTITAADSPIEVSRIEIRSAGAVPP